MIISPKFGDSNEQIQFYNENINILLTVVSCFLKSLSFIDTFQSI